MHPSRCLSALSDLSEKGKGSAMIQYRQIDPDSLYPYGLVIDGVQVAVPIEEVRVGMIVQIALKSEVRPAAVSSPLTRLMAPYVQKVIVSPDVCTSCAHDVDNDDQTICRNCVESWGWDWLVRFDPKFNSHGNARTYHVFGCRCPECRWAQKVRYGTGASGAPGVVRGRMSEPTTHARVVRIEDQF